MLKQKAAPKPVRPRAQFAAIVQQAAQGGHSARRTIELAALLVPYLVGTLGLVVIPALLSFALAFTQYDALSPPVWVGLQNFSDIFGDWVFHIAVRNTSLFIVLSIPMRMLGVLLLALLLHKQRRGVKKYRVAVYLPTIIPDAAYALIWLWMFNPLYGPINMILGMLGLPQPAWLVEQSTALPSIAIMSLFQIGEGFVVLLAGLQNIPDDYYQSAALEGGNRWQIFRFITLPLLTPWLLLLTIRDIIMSVQNTFAPVYLMTYGGPYYATYVLPFHMYEEAFDLFRFGRASALMFMTFLCIGLLLVLFYDVMRDWGIADDH